MDAVDADDVIDAGKTAGNIGSLQANDCPSCPWTPKRDKSARLEPKTVVKMWMADGETKREPLQFSSVCT
jgi:hypothetical protein